MNIVTGCSGIDAIAYAALLLDIELIGQIEIDPFCNTILDLRYPGVKRYKDIFNVRGDEFGAVDIFAAGIPCQPFSHAGKREGTEDDRYLWPEAIRIIRIMQPTWVIIENVDGIGSMEQSNSEAVMETETEICQDAEMVLETIRKDLEEAGYNSIPIILPACSVEAPHQRYRYFIVANTSSSQRESRPEKQGILREMFENKREFNYSNRPSETCKSMADTSGERLQRYRGEYGLREDKQKAQAFRCGDVADTKCNGLQGQREHKFWSNSEEDERKQADRTFNASNRPAQSGMGGNADGLPGGIYKPGGQEDSSGILEAFEEIFTATLNQILWPAGYGAEQRPYEPPRVASGVKNRTNRLKALGNAIVPWQIFPILLAIKLIERYGYEH